MKKSKAITPTTPKVDRARKSSQTSKPKKESKSLVAAATPPIPNWRTIPIPVVWAICEAWAGWKQLTRPLPVKSFQLDGYDFDMQVVPRPIPEVKVSKRRSQILRSSHQMRMAKLKAELEDLKAVRQTVQAPLDGNARFQAALNAAKETNADLEWIRSHEEALIGWDIRERELHEQLRVIDETMSLKEVEMRKLVQEDLNAIEEWSFNLGELV